jgi:uncharacterized protein with ATP-grasp and redox domains
MNTPPTLPPFVQTSDPDSFARYTVLKRFPGIAAQVMADNSYPPEVNAALQSLIDEVAAGGDVTPLSETFPNQPYWDQQLASQPTQTWLGLIWFYSEVLFYQRILDVVKYFQPGELKGRDPYWKQKQDQISADIGVLVSVYDQFESLNPAGEFDMILHSSLWGNRADLSMTALIGGSSASGLSTRDEQENILTDNTRQAREYLAKGVKIVDVINDNVGSDALFDLVLADFLIRKGWAQQVRFNLKDRPFFISDAMPGDIMKMIETLQAVSLPSVQELGQRLFSCLQTGQLVLKSDSFWTSADVFALMPPHITRDLARADLLIFKGDANYRRILGERAWPFDTALETAAAYFPFSFLALRTIKCEILAGIESEKARQMNELRQKEMLTFVNGMRGVIQMRLLKPQGKGE